VTGVLVADVWRELHLSQANVISFLRECTDLLWLSLLAIFVVKALRTKRTVQSQSVRSGLVQTGFVAVGLYLVFADGVMLAGPDTGLYRWLDRQIVPVDVQSVLAGFFVVLCGIAFTVWARLALGTNWSGVITLKQDHTLVRRGPYRIVRHPIYTGLLLALLGSALERGQVRNLLGVLVCGFGLWLKSRIEEQFMVQRFGDAYLRYRREVKALVPFLF
jgi:protein-S-isoprenylcysteine O-methyltransferase Ste14